MTTNIILLVVVLLSVCLSMFIMDQYLSYQFKGKIASGETLLTTSLFKVCCYVMCALLMHELITPMQTLIKVLPTSKGSVWGGTISYFVFFLGIIIIASFLVFWLAQLTWSIFTKGRNIFFEASNDQNTGLVILFCGILIGLAIVCQKGVAPILDEFIPYPTVPVYR